MSKFKGNLSCVLIKQGATDVYGEIADGERKSERCSVVRFLVRSEKTTVRADSSASRGAAYESTADVVLLFGPNSTIAIDDKVELLGATMRVTGRFPRHDVNGKLDHYQVEGEIWA